MGVLEPLPGRKPAFTPTCGGGGDLKPPIKPPRFIYTCGRKLLKDREIIETLETWNLLVVTAHCTTELPRTNYRWVKMHLTETESLPAIDLLWQGRMAANAETSE